MQGNLRQYEPHNFKIIYKRASFKYKESVRLRTENKTRCVENNNAVVVLLNNTCFKEH